MTIKIRLIKENLNKTPLLTEIKVDDVLKTCASKATKKVIFYYLAQYDKETGNENNPDIEQHRENTVNHFANTLAAKIENTIPNDLEDDQKGLAAAWIKRYYLSDYQIFINMIVKSGGSRADGGISWNAQHHIENFFKFQRFITGPTDKNEYRDLMKIPDLDQLIKIVGDESQPAELYKKWIEQKNYKDAEQGTEVIYEDNEFKIFIPNNKGAACELGKGTQWCTAAPGLDYYEQYHKPDDPLFVIFVKKTNGVEKFQFHYGTAQFMTAADTPIAEWPGGIDLFKKIHRILVQTVGDRFPFLKDSMIETDMGVSVRTIGRSSDCEECPSYLLIQYKDIINDNIYGGEYPANTRIYDEGQYEISFEWKYPERRQVGHPLKVLLSLENGKPTLGTAYWYIRNHRQTFEIALWNGSLKINSSNIYRYLLDGDMFDLNASDEEHERLKNQVWMENGGEFYKHQIENNPNQFAERLFNDYVPDDVKKEIEDKIEYRRKRQGGYYLQEEVSECAIHPKPALKIKVAC